MTTGPGVDDAAAEAGPPSAEEFKYSAFISYRHVEPDRGWAKWLHAALETYRVPPRLARERGLPRRVEPVFRDEDELPASADLNGEIETALRASRFLIVVCSPRTPESLWVNREVLRFREMGRHGRILALLVEGSPRDAFPAALREIRRTVTDAAGLTREEVEQVEPLAADVRPDRKERRGHLGNMARLRLLACLLGVSYDDLRQREHERRVRRLRVIGAVLAVLVLALGGLTMVAVSQRAEANRQRAEADRQRAEAEVQRDAATREKLRAERQVAEGLVLRADALSSAGRWLEARAIYDEGAVALAAAGLSTFAADTGLWAAEQASPGPLLEWRAASGPPPLSIDFSADGRRMVTGSGDGVVREWDVVTGRLVREMKGNAGPVSAVAYSPDGQTVASGAGDGTVRLWGAGGGAARVLEGGKRSVACVGFSPDGTMVAAGGYDGALRAWDAAGGNLRFAMPLKDTVRAVRFFPDGKRMAVAAGKVRIIDVATRAEVRALASEGAATLAMSADGSRLMFEGEDTKVTVWDTADWRAVRTMAGHERAQVSAAAFVGKRNDRAVTGGWDKVVRVWDLAGDKELRAFAPHEGWVLSAAVAPDGRRLVSGGFDGVAPMRMWDLEGAGPAIGGKVLDLSADGLSVLVEGTGGALRVVDVASGRDVRAVAGTAARKVATNWDVPGSPAVNPPARGMWLGLSPDRRLGLVYDSEELFLRDQASGRDVWRVTPDETVIAARFSGDGRTIVTWNEATPTVFVRDAGTGARLAQFTRHSEAERVEGAALSADGRFAVSATGMDAIDLWDARTGAAVRRFSAAGSGLVRVAIAPDASWVAACGEERSVWVWDAASGRLVRKIPAGWGPTGLKISADGGTMLVTGRTPRVCEFSRGLRGRALAGRVTAARAALAVKADDAGALATLGEWYAFRRADDWAVELMERGRAGGASVPAVELARAYWRLGRGAEAGREFRRAVAEGAGPAEYLKSCAAAAEGLGK